LAAPLVVWLAHAQVADPNDRLKRCQLDVVQAKDLAESAANSKDRKPEEAARLLGSLGAQCAKAGNYGAAEPLLRKALAVQEEVLGPEHPDTATSMNNLAWLLNAKGEYALAEPLYREALAIREKVEGPEHPDTAMSLNNLADLLRERGDYAAAEPLYRRALAIQEKVLGPEHPDTATSLNNLALLLAAKGNYAAAEPLYRGALAIQEKILGPEHPTTATLLTNLALTLAAKGDSTAAEPLYRRALAIREKVLGAEHPDTATSLNNLASLLVAKGDYTGAEPLFRRAITIQARALGSDHPAIATSLNNLAVVLYSKGRYAEAEAVYRQALTLQQRLLGAEHPDTARTVSNLAVVLAARGDYAAAEPLYRQALAIREKVLGPEHPDTATSLNNLGWLLATRGNYAGAEPLYRRTLAIREKVLGLEHPDTAPPLNNLALLLVAKGDYTGAEPLYRRALAIQEKAAGPENPEAATTLSNLAELFAAKGDPWTAEQSHRRALAIREKVLGPDNPKIAESLNNLAFLLASTGQYTAAEPAFRRALEITEKALGPEHPNTIRYLYNLAALMWAEGRSTEARALGERANRTEVTNLSRWLMPFEETEQRAFLQSLTPVDMLISFQLDQPQDKAVQRDVLWALLQRKGRLQEIRAVQQRLAARQPELFHRWQFAQRALETCIATGVAGASLQQPAAGSCSNGSEFSEKYRSANEALLALYAKVPREEQDLGVVELEELLGSLRDGGWALVEIAEYNVFRPYRPQAETRGGSRYAAYLVFADGRIEFKDLGEAGGINTAVAKVRKLEADPTSNMTSVRAAAKELYERTLGQLDRELKGQGKLYVAADGDLGLVDFSSLMDRNGHWFLEDHLVVNLTSGRDLVRLERAATERKGTHGDYLVANPSFLFRDARMARANSDRSGSTKQVLGSPTGGCSVAFGKEGRWPRVGITAQEIGGFRTALPGLKVYEREQARESVVKEIARPRTLWFITHGFFCQNAPAGGVPKGLTERMWDDPMLRGALVLAGAQVGGVGDGEDGYLQSTEIVDRDWQGAELAVLGACETALGVPSIGDGVYGMRRAFIVAGVRSQVMTLWRVSHAPTFELLEAFANFLHAGKGKADALREAQRQMLRKYPHPYYWAGFHFTGDPAPLAAN
jgi:tetratricopeptide (TPR) repeat protein